MICAHADSVIIGKWRETIFVGDRVITLLNMIILDEIRFFYQLFQSNNYYSN